ncbi:hypothetical protein [Bartonella sp. WD16.2]|uniref:hypothetical protein n=1 Tax=Bartonella sp. WD16.2 TaxID=1933904 RepID=UPI001885BA27|nr:hypothetical protein [Bartonella sp. WD16.2]
MSRDSVGSSGVGRDAVKKDDEREDAVREDGGGGDEDKTGVDEANANGEIYPLP